MMAGFQCYLDPLSPQKAKQKTNVRVGPRLAKLSESAHAYWPCTVNVLKFQTLFTFFSQIKCWSSEGSLELIKCMSE